jgi:two-component system, response regulator PdtaR
MEPAMHRKYRIAFADSDPAVRETLRTELLRAGHKVIVEASSSKELIERCTANEAAVELVIVDIKIDGMSGIEAGEAIVEHRNIPFIIVADSGDDDLIEQAVTHRAFAFLLKPIRTIELQAAIQMAVQRFEELQTCRMETASMRQALVDRKAIERAKGILMRKRSLDEPSAFAYLQQLSRQHRQKLIDVANIINLADKALNDAIME